MLDLSIETGALSDVEQMLTDAERKHLPFASAVALTRTAKIIQQQTVRNLPREFDLRNAWTEKGIRVRPATKNRAEAAVFTRDWYMADQLTGGYRSADGSAGRDVPGLLVPTLEARRSPSIAEPVARANRPKQLFRKVERAKAAAASRKTRRRRRGHRAPKPFVATIGGKPGVFIRRHAARRLPIVRLYTGVRGYRIARRWSFHQSAERISEKQVRVQFLKAMRSALAGSRRGPKRSAYVEHLIRDMTYRR